MSENLSELYSNQRTLFGRGSLDKLVPLLAVRPQPTLLFCGQSFLQGAAYARLKAGLNDHIIGYEIVSHEASPAEIDGWVARWRGHVDRVVAIGGGSVLDAAKAFSAMVQHPLPTARYLEKVGDTAVQPITLPLIAIPTTAGTGSEVTQNAVVTDQRDIQIKASLRHPVFVPEVAILDADLLKGAPDRVLATCGIDAFTHLFEAYLSGKGNLFTRQMALTGLRQFVQAWPALNREDAAGDAAREAMMMASWLGGVSLSSAGLGVIHGIAGELGAIKPFHHGEVCGRLLFPFLDLLSDSEQPLQRKLMAELHPQLFSETTDSPAQFLKQWLQQQAITPFWQDGPSLSRAEVEWILARANSKNSLVNYSREQMQMMIAQAWQITA
ncbi:iron-containing alcohol dehydrogenase [Pantoea agglomerans]|uniref:iron-containing alcohol dehydrogenase n=1 Tax=Enterobacter agglomerans TaxID=549 RepID=UPI00057C6050|nr:iron-containing alcohol dehydrogenase [Pantoea agglomerans]KIC85591.1 alcohol dehydrogenase [Pantoea agglomerans]MBA5705314.1 iron-containing alcohol dehydrogenase [Pantoea agglomerans]MBN9929407.1 iron-containing alcohol dehydrogenase [Pantoea agglomerans]MCH9405437.1 iron-containing alcohol dehydrogenase [Pantoea agglomerans]UJL38089.1 iron-containing alcohol dehydrogenase [Pantoea agglomerans]